MKKRKVSPQRKTAAKAQASPKKTKSALVGSFSSERIMQDYKIAYISRQASLLGRKEALTGKAKFGIFGDGKELAQIAMAANFKKGDWRSGYYRDQTFLMALGQLSVRQFFAQLYADPDPAHEPNSAGRQMNNHPASRFLTEDGEWLRQTELYNTSSDISPTGGQMPRLLGLAYASKLYRAMPEIDTQKQFSVSGNEVAFGTIGNASTSEGMFYETMNAACVLQVPILMSVWDDGYGISVPQKYHTTKESISKALAGFEIEEGTTGLRIFKVKGYDYVALQETYAKAVEFTRSQHIPSLVHVVEMTQPQGHSTSGSHERYKSKERLQWEEDFDCIAKFRDWILQNQHSSELELSAYEQEWQNYVKQERDAAWQDFISPIEDERATALQVLEEVIQESQDPRLEDLAHKLRALPVINRKMIASTLTRAQVLAEPETQAQFDLQAFGAQYRERYKATYTSKLHLEKGKIKDLVPVIPARYDDNSELVDGRVILRDFFHLKFADDPRLFVIGEDVGFIGDVNQVFENLQKKFGELRCTDTGIREMTILGQGLGAAMRGLRPIVDIQYLDYLLYCYQTISDDVATLHYRSAGQQIAPVIIRTKGHRLEGIWHSGSPISMILGGIRGLNFCVPRNMTQAAGLYNTLLQTDEPSLLIEVLSGYRMKEKMPANLGSYTVPLGIPDIIREGQDVTVVTYGFNVRIAEEAAEVLSELGISIEIIDVQTLLPFDTHHSIKDSLKKTNAVIFFDEDVPGGATAYMMQKVLDEQKAYDYLDAQPICISAEANRPAYGSDGDYFSKSNAEDLINGVLRIMHDRNPQKFRGPVF